MSVFNNEQAQLIQIAVAQGGYPRYVYKYRKLDARLDQILVNNELWFSKPNEFNDPFDCQIVPSTETTFDEFREFVKRADPSISNKTAENLARNAINNPDQLKSIVEQTISATINNSGVCCFCGNRDNILLWAHYADSHKGVCLKYDILSDLDFFVTPLKVRYQTQYPTYNHFREQSEFLKKMVMTKSNHWEYEEEIRILKMASGATKFSKEALVEVIFGAKVSEGDKDRVRMLAADNGYSHLECSQSSLKDREYGLNFTKI